MPEPLRVAVLVSGTGSNLQALIDACRGGALGAEIAVAISNVPHALALERARRAGISAVIVNHKAFPTAAAFEARLSETLAAHHIDLVCLAGFLRILSPGFVSAFRGRIVNIHPALLPAFGGKGMYGERVHRAVLASGATESGCTVHFVTEIPDGGPIIAQATVPVESGDTPATLAARVAKEEHHLYPEVVRLFALGRIRLDGDRVSVLPPLDSALRTEAR